jgi:hypothetical protein
MCPCRSVNKAEREKQVKTANSLWGAQAVAAEDKKLKRRASLTAHRETAAAAAATAVAAPATGTTHYIDQDVRSGSGSGGRGSGSSRGRSGRSRAGRSRATAASPSSANGRANGRSNGRGNSIPSPVLLVRPGYVAPNGYVYPLAQQQYVQELAQRGHASQQHHMLQQQQQQQNNSNNNYHTEPAAAPAAPASPALHATARSFVPTLISESSTEGMNPRAPAWIPGGGFKT